MLVVLKDDGRTCTTSFYSDTWWHLSWQNRWFSRIWEKKRRKTSSEELPMAFPRRFWTRLFHRFLSCGIDTSYILTFKCRSKKKQGCCTAARPLVGRDSLIARIWQEELDNIRGVYGESITSICPTIAWFWSSLQSVKRGEPNSAPKILSLVALTRKKPRII